MARIRTVKPDFWKNEDLSELAPEVHILAAALLNHSDDEGYFKANPKLVKAECCPLRDDSTTIRRCLDELSSIGYIRLFFGFDGKEYGHVTKFLTHQRVDRPKPSVIKALEDSTKDRRKIDDESTQEGKGREVAIQTLTLNWYPLAPLILESRVLVRVIPLVVRQASVTAAVAAALKGGSGR